MSSFVSNGIYAFIKLSGGYNWNKTSSQDAFISSEDKEDSVTNNTQIFICKYMKPWCNSLELLQSWIKIDTKSNESGNQKGIVIICLAFTYLRY